MVLHDFFPLRDRGCRFRSGHRTGVRSYPLDDIWRHTHRQRTVLLSPDILSATRPSSTPLHIVETGLTSRGPDRTNRAQLSSFRRRIILESDPTFRRSPQVSIVHPFKLRNNLFSLLTLHAASAGKWLILSYPRANLFFFCHSTVRARSDS